MTTTDRCDEIVRLIDGALADCRVSTSRQRARRRSCPVPEKPQDAAVAQRHQLLAAVDDFLARSLVD